MSTKAFHSFLRNGVNGPVEVEDMQRLITLHQENTSPTCFTHGDLSSFNILVRDGKIAGLIDWEMSGWLPDYWEYTSAWHVNPYDEFWREEVDRFLEPHGKELEMERLRRRFFGRS